MYYLSASISLGSNKASGKQGQEEDTDSNKAKDTAEKVSKRFLVQC